MWYLGYIQGGHTTKAEGGGEKIQCQFYVERELQDIGINCWLPREIKFERRGNQRRPEPFERPLIPNYIFIDASDERFLDVLGVKYLAGTLRVLNRRDVESLGYFREVVDTEYAKAKRAAENQEAISEYTKGQKLAQKGGAFSDKLLTFVEMVERAHDLHPKIRASMEIMGREVVAEFDPLDIKAAE